MWMRAIVGQHPVEERRQPRRGVVVLVGDRLVAGIAAGHHERATDPGEDEVVERAVRQHHAQLRRARRDIVGDGDRGSTRPTGHEHDRPAR